ncbi:MAG TPA: radical SAM protein [Myxococcota bacterium]|nr:radical SAM protein [Myxococcota bacterium]
MEKNRIYGPVPSRRLGFSLGIDLVEYKHCPLDCIYCQLKRTTRLDASRETTVEIEEVVRQVDAKIATGARVDHLTLGGSGEPTLYGQLGGLIDALHERFDIPVALLTNGVLFGDPAVRAEAARADVVLPSLDAWDQESFELVNRPIAGMGFEAFMDGMIRFRQQYRGLIWLEVMLLAGISDNPDVISRLAAQAARLKPDRIQLNTPVRPPATDLAIPISRQTMTMLADLFKPPAEVTADFPEPAGNDPETHVTTVQVLETITRRPCTARDVAVGLNAPEGEVSAALRILVGEGRIVLSVQDGKDYFKLPA